MSTQITPCTRAIDVRERALEPLMNVLASTDRKLDLIVEAYRDTRHPSLRELARLVKADRDLLRPTTGYLDGCASRLHAAELGGNCGTTGRTIAGELRGPLKTLMDSSRRRLEHDKARTGLHALFATYGDAVFESRVTTHLGPQQVLAMRGEMQRVMA